MKLFTRHKIRGYKLLHAAVAGAFAACLALSACSVVSVPDYSYFRMPRAQALPASTLPWSSQPIVVSALVADGLYGDQPLVYALDAQARELRQYHYQLWADPPTRVIQRRLIGLLRNANAAGLVTDELPASRPALHIGGAILRFDRVPREAGGFGVVVVLKLSARDGEGEVLVENIYRSEMAATDTSLGATVTAFGVALDDIFARFYAELLAHKDVAHAR
ncbi:MAG: ABC-type transport auxiliary lipoprotein family protein [Dokdonella sp.]